MRKPIVFLFLFAVIASSYYGIKNHTKVVEHLPRQGKKETAQQTLSACHPLLEDQSFVAIVLGGNDAPFVERCLTSLATQTYPNLRTIYIDNGSTDGTCETAQKLAEGNKVEIVRFSEKKPVMEVLYQTIQNCSSHEIVALIEGKDWLAHENVFDHLNEVYANPDVWMTYSRAIHHPDFQVVEGHRVEERTLESKRTAELGKALTPLTTFYASFFKEIKLEDALSGGEFIDDSFRLAVALPLVEMGPKRICFVDEISYVKNNAREKVDHKLHLEKVAEVEKELGSLPPYAPLTHLTIKQTTTPYHRYKADVVIFSEDSPLHLYATLESLYSHVRDINSVYVLYEGSDPEFQRAYLNLSNEFHTAQFLNICDFPGHDLQSLLTKVLENKRHASPFVLFATDRLIFDESVRFHDAIEAMEKTHADHFLITFETQAMPQTKAIPLGEGIYAYQLGAIGAGHPFCLSLCRKTLFHNLKATDLPSFKSQWKEKQTPHAVALFFEERKTLPLNIPSETTEVQKKEWGHKFIEGFKIDLTSLSCEMEEVAKGELPLIKRERRRPIPQS
ncbi:MAG: glycosyltransferase family 2 protein [Chlamydiia bacterium]|nr:glycosyltransferase family 2 protein [Chlamydiia bacterium]